MRLDKQHKEARAEFLGIPIYPGSHGLCDPRYFIDMCEATARVAREHVPRLQKKRVGASTGGVWACQWAWQMMPEPYASELAAHYRQVVIEKAEERKRKDAERAANTPAP